MSLIDALVYKGLEARGVGGQEGGAVGEGEGPQAGAQGVLQGGLEGGGGAGTQGGLGQRDAVTLSQRRGEGSQGLVSVGEAGLRVKGSKNDWTWEDKEAWICV
jgi:hypothetical protein